MFNSGKGYAFVSFAREDAAVAAIRQMKGKIEFLKIVSEHCIFPQYFQFDVTILLLILQPLFNVYFQESKDI